MGVPDEGEALLQRVAAAAAAAVVERLAPMPEPSRRLATVTELCALYAASPEARALKDWQTEEGRIAHIVELLGVRRAAALTLADIDEYRTARIAQVGKRKTKPATRNREVVRLGAILKWAAARCYIARNPLPPLTMEPENNQRQTYRSEDDIRRIVDAAIKRGRFVIAAMIATKFDAGLRRKELCRMQLDQLDTADGVIVVRAGHTKAGEERVTVLSSWSMTMIRAIDRPRGCPWVFPSRLGKPYYPRTFLRFYQEACEDAGIAAAEGERNWAHDCRSGFGDRQVQLLTPIHDVMKMAGWRDYRTAKRYLRRGVRLIAMAARQRLEKARKSIRLGPRKAPVDKKSRGSHKMGIDR